MGEPCFPGWKPPFLLYASNFPRNKYSDNLTLGLCPHYIKASHVRFCFSNTHKGAYPWNMIFLNMGSYWNYQKKCIVNFSLKYVNKVTLNHATSLKLSFTNIRGLRSNFFRCMYFLQSNAHDILALCDTNCVTQLIVAMYHIYGLAIYMKEELPFARDDDDDILEETVCLNRYAPKWHFWHFRYHF